MNDFAEAATDRPVAGLSGKHTGAIAPGEFHGGGPVLLSRSQSPYKKNKYRASSYPHHINISHTGHCVVDWEFIIYRE